jgi:hypothetical protein
MIIKGNRHNDGAKLARYMMTGERKKDERAEFYQLRGFDEADNILDAFRDVEVMGGAGKAENALFHVQVRLPEHERLTDAQWEQTADRIEKRLRLTGQARAIYFHVNEQTGERHMHVGWSLIDTETMKAKPVPFFKLRLKALARELEKEFGLTQVKNEREGPIKYAATKNEQQQAQRLGVDKDAIRNTIRACWDRSDCGHGFDDELANEGLILAQGNRRDYVVIDHAGGIHALGKRLLDVSAAQVRAKLADLDRDNMPTIEQAREFMLDLPHDRTERLGRELEEVQKQIEAEQAPLIADLARRYINDLDAYHAEMADLYNRAPDIAHEVQKRVTAALHAEIDQHFPDRTQELLDELFPGTRGNEHQAQAEQPAPIWDRDAYENAWQQSVIDNAIEHGKAETRAGRDRKPSAEQKKQPKPSELGKTQAEIRLARTLTPGPQSFANALEDRGFILARVTPGDIAREMEQLRKEWEERRRHPQTWMEHEGGFKALSPELQDSARRSFDAWEEKQEQERQKQQEQHGKKASVTPELSADDIQKRFESYVEYVQRKWAEGPKSQLERATGGLAVIAPHGSIYTLTPRNTGLDRDELPEYLKGIDRAPLLTVTDAQTVMQELRDHRRVEWQAQQPLGHTAGEIRLAYSLTQTGPAFAAALEDRGLILACMTDSDAERLNRWERQRLKEQAQALENTGKVPAKDRAAQDKYRAGELLVVNQYGQVFQLTAHNTGQDKDQRLKQIDPASLLSVTAAQGVMKEFQQYRQEEKRQVWQQQREARWQPVKERHWPVMPAAPERKSSRLFEQAAQEMGRDHRTENLTGPAAHIWNAFRHSGNEGAFQAFIDGKEKLSSVRTGDRQAFAAVLDEKGIAFAMATKEEADNSYRQAEFAKAVGNYSPRFAQGEIVIVTTPRLEYRRDGEIMEPRRVWKLDQSLAEKYVKLLDNRSQLLSIEATKQTLDERGQRRAAELQAERIEKIIKHAPDFAPSVKKAVRSTRQTLHQSAAIAKAPARAIGALLDAGASTAGILFSLVDAPKSPRLQEQENREGERSTARRNAEAEIEIDFSRHVAEQAQEQQSARDRQRERERER